MFRCRRPRAFPAWLACVGLAAAVQAAAAGEERRTQLPQYRITRWTVENGLPQNNINALAQTRDGYLWVGTLKGLARFDGVRFKVFDRSNTPELTHEAINHLAVDVKDDSLWIGTTRGLLHYHGYRFERFGPAEGVPAEAGSLQAAREGGVWFSSRPGQVALARGGRIRSWRFSQERDENRVHQVGEVSPDEVLLLLGSSGSAYSLHRLNLNTRSLTRLSTPAGSSPQERACLSFLQVADDSLWLCTGQGIWRGRDSTWTRVTSADPQSAAWPQQICPASDGQIWATQFEGDRISLQRLVRGQLEPFVAPELPGELNVTQVLEDREGNLWVGTTTGVLRLEPKRIRVYSRRDGLPSDGALAVTQGADGAIWVGTTAGVGRIRDGKVEPIPPPGMAEKRSRVAVLLADKQNALWLGWAGHSLARFQQGKWQEVTGPAEIGDARYLKAIYEDHSDRLWLSSGDGVLCNDAGQWRYYTATNGLSYPDVRVFYQDRRTDLWLGTFGGGLFRLKDGKFTAYRTTRGELNNRAWWIHEDADGVFWVGSEDGLNRFVPPGVEQVRGTKSEVRRKQSSLAVTDADDAADRFFTFTTGNGLGENVVNNIQEDAFGDLWLSGLRGTYRISRKELNEVAAGQRARVRCVAFGEADGMLNSECNGGDNQPAGCKDEAGRIWFPTIEGVVAIDPREMRRTESPPPVVIEQVRANDRVIFGDGSAAVPMDRSTRDPSGSTQNHRVELGPGGARVLEIHYTGNSLVAPERVRFRYRLEGHNRDWLADDQNRRVAFYTNLRPGDYTFRVLACNSRGLWNEVGDQFAFHLAPHFYETWPFYSACVALILVGGPTVHYRRIRALRRLQRLEQQRALHEERARIAKDLHDDLGANLTGLALQLDLAQNLARPADALQTRLAGLARTTRGLVDNMREVVWAMNPQNDNVESLTSFLGQYTENYLAAAGVRCRLELPPQGPSRSLSSNARHQLFLVVKEALHNIVRHARAGEVQLRIEQEPDELRLSISDDGCGLPPAATRNSDRGLDHMASRVESLGGRFSAAAGADRGTRLEVAIPLGRGTSVSSP